MTQEQINSYSVLMAEFMGWEIKHNDNGDIYLYHITYSNLLPNEFEYHLDYNELMPVWTKFRDLEIENSIAYNSYIKKIKEAILYGSIESVFLELAFAIEWYNTIKK